MVPFWPPVLQRAAKGASNSNKMPSHWVAGSRAVIFCLSVLLHCNYGSQKKMVQRSPGQRGGEVDATACEILVVQFGAIAFKLQGVLLEMGILAPHHQVTKQVEVLRAARKHPPLQTNMILCLTFKLHIGIGG